MGRQRVPISPRQQRGRAVRLIRPPIRASYDSAQTTDNNSRHWSAADSLSADAAASVSVRKKLRNRSRYEVANNCYAKGLVSTVAGDTVGTGPRLQMTGSRNSKEDNRFIEQEFMSWLDEMSYDEILRTMRAAQATDGESFALQKRNPLMESPVKFDLRLIEAEQCATPYMYAVGSEPNEVDGIVFDRYGNPAKYYILQNHPGATTFSPTVDAETVDPKYVHHLYRPDRPGQRRGVSEICAALPLFALLRRMTLATVHAAETAASFAALMYTDMPADGEAAVGDAFATLDIEHNMMTTIPDGWKAMQLKAEHPASTYEMFKREIINEAARVLCVPYNIIAGNSSGYNYASGRLDWQTYFRMLGIDRRRMVQVILDPLFKAWRTEAVLIEGYLPQTMRTINADWRHQYMWPGTAHVDPQKEATAQAIRLESGTTTYAEEFARSGLDWEEQFQQQAKENELRRKLGLVTEKAKEPDSEEDLKEPKEPAEASWSLERNGEKLEFKKCLG